MAFEIIHLDQESQGTDDRDSTWQTRHSSFSQFLAFMILSNPVNFIFILSIIELNKPQSIGYWSQWSMIDWLGYLMTIRLRIWEQIHCGRGLFRANHLPAHHHHHHKHIRQHPGYQSSTLIGQHPLVVSSHWPRLGVTLILNYLISPDPGRRHVPRSQFYQFIIPCPRVILSPAKLCLYHI